MSALDRIDANRPAVRKVIEDSAHAAELDLNPVARSLLHDLGRALYHGKAVWRLRAIGTPGVVNADRARHVEALLPLVREAFTLTLGPDQADELASELWESSADPVMCDLCGDRYATVGLRCGFCDQVLSFNNAQSGGRL